MDSHQKRQATETVMPEKTTEPNSNGIARLFSVIWPSLVKSESPSKPNESSTTNETASKPSDGVADSTQFTSTKEAFMAAAAEGLSEITVLVDDPCKRDFFNQLLPLLLKIPSRYEKEKQQLIESLLNELSKVDAQKESALYSNNYTYAEVREFIAKLTEELTQRYTEKIKGISPQEGYHAWMRVHHHTADQTPSTAKTSSTTEAAIDTTPRPGTAPAA